MMHYYVPMITRNWGDRVTALWAAELLHNTCPEATISIDGTFAEDKRSPAFHINEWFSMPWISQDVSISVANACASQEFDGVVATHHRHYSINNRVEPKTRASYVDVDGEKLLFFDAHGLTYRMIRDDWYPTLIPTDKLLQAFEDLHLPQNYVVLHINDEMRDKRNVAPARHFFKTHLGEIKSISSNCPLVTTAAHLDSDIAPSIDLARLPGVVKLYVIVRALHVITSFTGFTSIASTYRKRQRCMLVNNHEIPSFNMGPPNIAYSNCGIADPGSWQKLYYAVENGIIKNVQGDAYLRRCEQRQWCQFETFDFNDFDNIVLPPDYRPRTFYEHIDNCLVPLDAQYKLDGLDRTLDYRKDREMTSMCFMTWVPKKW
jgi:hypothetical protein